MSQLLNLELHARASQEETYFAAMALGTDANGTTIWAKCNPNDYERGVSIHRGRMPTDDDDVRSAGDASERLAGADFPTDIADRPEDWLAAFDAVTDPTPAYAALRAAVAALHPQAT